MDFTHIQGSINENATRKSLGRRVSFASHAQVRVFEKDPKRSGASPSAATDHPGPSAQSGTVLNDENDYPGASVARRRSSMRRSVAFSGNGEESMEMDSDLASSPLPAGFLAQGSFLQDEEPDDVSGVWDEEAEMDLTTNLASNRPRKSSLGLSSLPQSEDMGVDDHSYAEDMTQDSAVDVSGEQAEPTEFTVPLNKSLRKPGPPSAEWLALRAVTHAGSDAPYEPPPSDDYEDEPSAHRSGIGLGEEDMDLTEAETRLRRMRESLGLADVAQEDSFTSSEGSSIGGDDNQTVNLTNAWRESLGTDSSSTMDFTNIQGTSGGNSADETVNRVVSPVPAPQEPRVTSEAYDSRAQPAPPEPSSVTPLANDIPAPPVPPVFTKPGPVFSAPKRGPPSPSRPKSPASPRKTGTAAFALPVACPQPKRPAVPPGADNEGSSHFECEESPAKRQALQRSPSKPTAAATLTEGETTPSAARRSSVVALRRPSGYFAQRRSLGPSGAPNIPQPTSPRRRPVQGRASEADTSRMDQSMVNVGRENVEPSPSLPHPQFPIDDPSKGTGLSVENDPLPLKPPLFAVYSSVPSAESEASTTQPTVTLADVDATEQWRNGVQPPSFTEEDDGVRILFITLSDICAYPTLASHIYRAIFQYDWYPLPGRTLCTPEINHLSALATTSISSNYRDPIG